MKNDDTEGKVLEIYNDRVKDQKIKVKKTWEGTPLKEIKVKLNIFSASDAKKTESLILNEENNWQGEFKDLPIVDSKGFKIDYSITEVINVDGEEIELNNNEEKVIEGVKYKSTIKEVKNSEEKILKEYEINNIVESEKPLEPEKTSVKVQKEWIGTAGESAEIILLKNNEEYKTVELNEKNNWEHEFKDLPVVDNINDSNSNIYSIKETPVKGYTTTIEEISVNNYTVINTEDIEKIDLTVEKVWVGLEKEYDGDVNLELYRNGEHYIDGEKEYTITLNKNTGWKYIFKDLPKYDENGEEYIYTIEEPGLDEERFSVEVFNKEGTENHIIVENSVRFRDVHVKKIWEGKVGESAKFLLFEAVRDEFGNLVKKPIETETKFAGRVKLNKYCNCNWEGTFENIEFIDENGARKEYILEEEKIPNYDSKVIGNVEDGFVVTNTWNPEKININITKHWLGEQLDKIEVYLLANGQIIKTMTMEKKDWNENEDWKGQFSDLDKYDEFGNLIYYTVEENVEILDGRYNVFIEGDAKEGFKIINLSNFPINPGKPTDPPEPTDPDDPDDPDEPGKPNKPEKPNEPNKPNKPNEPNDPNKPNEPNDPNDPNKPNEPNDPNEPNKPSKPNDPNEPNKPNKPNKPNRPSKPNKPNEPNEPSEPSKPNKPNEPNEPSEPNEPNETEPLKNIKVEYPKEDDKNFKVNNFKKNNEDLDKRLSKNFNSEENSKSELSINKSNLKNKLLPKTGVMDMKVVSIFGLALVAAAMFLFKKKK